MLESSHQLSLKLMHRCPSCKGGIEESGIHILQETEGAIVAHVACQRCYTMYIAHIVASHNGIIGNALVTDLTFPEAKDVMLRPELSEDDVLSAYRALHSGHFFESIALQLNQQNN